MYKPLVALSSALLGSIAIGTGVYLQANPLAFTHSSRVDLDTYLYSEVKPLASAPLKALPDEAEPRVEAVELPPVVVSVPARARQLRSLAVPSNFQEDQSTPFRPAEQHDVTPRELRPCSGFREIGPLHVDDGVPHGSRGVRDLC